VTSDATVKTSGSCNSGSSWKRDRRSRHARGYGSAWVKLRAIVLKVNAQGKPTALCRACLERENRPTPATECDHIIPKHKGGSEELSNMQPLCPPCHAAKTQREAAEAQGRTLKPKMQFDAAGFPIWPEGR
jgi:5-methylcytosine-specific restriction protein A